MIDRDWNVWCIDNFMKLPHLNRKYPSGAAERRSKFSVLNLLGCCLWFHAFP